ncbi:hypothetical protein RAM70_18090 [Microcystis wesenbergii NRERC-220]|uniref:DUF7149 domain-containing protein n=1 Tax=Microcystis wesenbergii NRERC-220 TaxID=3068991 RepID=A0ABU3HP51_9CHRO|nr:hypothetical protein [Microcystis wesenbergii]MDT3676331.1 hypothetical protein [Microcystis wesenbergii NRERC-220]
MIVNKRELKQTLNRVYLKIKPDTETIQVFQANLTRLLEQCDSKKSEEFNKNLLIDFLKNTYYTDRYFINTKERIDLVIHNNQDVKSPVGVIFETKKPQGVTKGFKGNQDKDSSQMNPKEIEWLRQPPKISICYHHSIRPVYKPA